MRIVVWCLRYSGLRVVCRIISIGYDLAENYLKVSCCHHYYYCRERERGRIET